MNTQNTNTPTLSAPPHYKLKAISLVCLGAVLGVAVSLHFSAVAEQKSALHNLPIDEVRMLSEVYGRIKSDYVENVDDKRIFKEAISGMLSGLDPHSTFLDADDYKEMRTTTSGKFGGLGIEIVGEDGFIKVVSPIDDTPAFNAGIKAGDYISRIDGVSVRGVPLNDSIKKMRGEPGKEVQVTILRKGETKELEFKVRRAIIEIQSVRARAIEPGYAVVRLSQFEETTGEKMVRAINDMAAKNPAGLKGIILDLRNDPGGLLNVAVGVSAAFLPKDTLVVYTDGRLEDSKMRFMAQKEHYLRSKNREDYLAKLSPIAKTVPLLVLVNNGSASASEIVAGALQDHKRAKVMGTQTFGKGSVQTIMDIGNQSAIKLTTARYYTPLGRSIQSKGITPDILVEDGFTRSATREADLGRHLIGPDEAEQIKAKEKAMTPAEVAQKEADVAAKFAKNKIRDELYESVSRDELTSFLKEPPKAADGKPIDFVLEQALKHLKGQPFFDSPQSQIAQSRPAKKPSETTADAKSQLPPGIVLK